MMSCLSVALLSSVGFAIKPDTNKGWQQRKNCFKYKHGEFETIHSAFTITTDMAFNQ